MLITGLFLMPVMLVCQVHDLKISHITGKQTIYPPLAPNDLTYNLLYGQLSNPSSENVIASQDFTDSTLYSCQAADDFIVPAGEMWTIDEMYFSGAYSPGGGIAQQAHLFIYSNHPILNIPDALVIIYMDHTVAATAGGDLTFDLTTDPIILGAGHYWISVQPHMANVPYGQWFWGKQESPTILQEFHWRNPGGGFGIPGTQNWLPSSIVIGGSDHNLTFGLYGTVCSPLLSVGSISANQIICSGATPAFLCGVAPSNGTAPIYQWQISSDNMIFTNIPGATNLNYQPGDLTATTWYRQMQNATGICGGPLPTNTITIGVLPQMVLSLVAINVTCIGGSNGSLTVTVSGGAHPYNYLWSNGSTNQAISGLMAGNYFVTVTDANGCSNSAARQIIIYDNQAPAIICPADILLHPGPGICQAIVPNADPVWSDNCPNAVLSYTLSGATPGSGPGSVSGMNFNAGVTEVVYTVTDASGRNASASFTVSVLRNGFNNFVFFPIKRVELNNAPVVLHALPPGGVFSGPGVHDTLFYGDSVGAGTFQLSYSYTDTLSGCLYITGLKVTVVKNIPCPEPYASNVGQRFDNWFFGENEELSFASGAPVVMDNKNVSYPMIAYGSTASISDYYGNILFYTDGFDVYDKNDVIINPGQPLTGAPLIVPRPNHPFNYYIFTAAYCSYSPVTSYSYTEVTIDVLGLPHILYTNQILGCCLSGQLTATCSEDGDYWVVAHGAGGGFWHENTPDIGFDFLVTKVTASGPEPPIDVYAYHQHFDCPEGPWPTTGPGEMKFSHDGTLIAYINNVEENSVPNMTGFIDIYSFNKNDGDIQFLYHFPFSPPNNWYTGNGLEFSPNDNLLYVSTSDPYNGNGYQLHQFDLTNAGNLLNTWTMTYAIGALQLGPDGKIYATDPYADYLHVIEKPNNASTSFNEDAIDISSVDGSCKTGLPKIDYYCCLQGDDPTVILNVSSAPILNVGIYNVAPDDVHYLANGTTNFTREYKLGTEVDLTAPDHVNVGTDTYCFKEWQFCWGTSGNSFVWFTSPYPNAHITMDRNKSCTAVYTLNKKTVQGEARFIQTNSPLYPSIGFSPGTLHFTSGSPSSSGFVGPPFTADYTYQCPIVPITVTFTAPLTYGTNYHFLYWTYQTTEPWWYVLKTESNNVLQIPLDHDYLCIAYYDTLDCPPACENFDDGTSNFITHNYYETTVSNTTGNLAVQAPGSGDYAGDKGLQVTDYPGSTWVYNNTADYSGNYLLCTDDCLCWDINMHVNDQSYYPSIFLFREFKPNDPIDATNPKYFARFTSNSLTGLDVLAHTCARIQPSSGNDPPVSPVGTWTWNNYPGTNPPPWNNFIRNIEGIMFRVDVTPWGGPENFILDSICLSPCAIDTVTLSVNSFPCAAVNVNAAPLDIHGAGTGTTSFTRDYISGTIVYLTAPPTTTCGPDQYCFSHWIINGMNILPEYANPVKVKMNADKNYKAIYCKKDKSVLVRSRIGTCSGADLQGVHIIYSPAGLIVPSTALTPFTGTYTYPACNLTHVSFQLTAPLYYGNYKFIRWCTTFTDCNGYGYSAVPTGNAVTISYMLDQDYECTAVYEECCSAIVTDASGASCCGSIDLTFSCGTPPYNYIWSNIATTEDIAGLCAGTYCVTVTDSHNIDYVCCWSIQNKKSTCQSTYLQNLDVTSGKDTCYDAFQTIYVAGNGTTFTVQNQGSATFIAGQNIVFYPGTKVISGGYLHGYVAPNGPWCGTKTASIVAVPERESETSPVTEKSFFTIYPNPTTGGFSLELKGFDETAVLRFELYGMRGERVLSEEMKGQRKYYFSLTGKPVGIYFIRVVSGKFAGTGKIIKQ